jgi:hypothetical protein
MSDEKLDRSLAGTEAVRERSCPPPVLRAETGAVMDVRSASWFWRGRFEGAHGGYVPPTGFWAGVLYFLGHEVGRRFGPPK